jgi:hypothetical protein
MVPGREVQGAKTENSVTVSEADQLVLAVAVWALIGTDVTAEGSVRWSFSRRDGAGSISFVESHKHEKHARLFHAGIVRLGPASVIPQPRLTFVCTL